MEGFASRASAVHSILLTYIVHSAYRMYSALHCTHVMGMTATFWYARYLNVVDDLVVSRVPATNCYVNQFTMYIEILFYRRI